jgi:nucleoside diphosphate-linked moiety X motif 19, mitochondrial
MELLMPMQFKVKDGFLHVLPGDDLYPENPNYHEGDHDIDQYADKTFEEMRGIAKNLCRSEQRDMFDVKIVSNVAPYDGHIKLESDPIAKM